MQPQNQSFQPKEYQVPQRDLKSLHTNSEDQVSQVDLKTKSDIILPNRVQDFLDIPISDIRQFNGVPDVQIPTREKYPTVVIHKDTVHIHCVDGWNFVEEAKSTNVESLRCHVYCCESFSMTGLSIFKNAIRSRLNDCIYSHSIMIKNIGLSFILLRAPPEIENKYPYNLDNWGISYNDPIKILFQEKEYPNDKKILSSLPRIWRN